MQIEIINKIFIQKPVGNNWLFCLKLCKFAHIMNYDSDMNKLFAVTEHLFTAVETWLELLHSFLDKLWNFCEFYLINTYSQNMFNDGEN